MAIIDQVAMKLLLFFFLLVGTLLFLKSTESFPTGQLETHNFIFRRQSNVSTNFTDPDGNPISISDFSKYSKRKNGNYVVDRKTGRISYELIPTKVRVALASAYAIPSIASSSLSRKLLKKMTRDKGAEMDKASSTKDIPGFIKDFEINMTEYKIQDASGYSTFNEFFAREIDLKQRPIEGGPKTLISAADSRLSVFTSAERAKSLWIKGKHFSVPKMLNVDTEQTGYENATLIIFRLAPQDYHRFHSPVDGKIVTVRDIPGEYYTVNPIAVRSSIDVYTDNHRIVIEIQRSNGKKIAYVCVGATLVGSIKLNVVVGSQVKRGDELGAFRYGGSTVISLIDNVKIDRPLVETSDEQLETVVPVRSRIGEFTD